MKKKKVFSIITVLLLGVLVIYTFSIEGSLSEEEKLVEEINFSSGTHIDELYFYEKYEPDLYFALGITESDEIYVGYTQIKKIGITANGSESLCFSGLEVLKKSYYCFEKTEEEGKFYFGFIDDTDIKSVNVNGQQVKVEYFNYPDNSKKVFGFWFLKTDWDYAIVDFQLGQSGDGTVSSDEV